MPYTGNMRFAVLLAALLAAVCAQSDKICDTYAKSFYGAANAQAEYQLIVLLVNTALVGNFTGPGTNHSYLPGSALRVPGILNPGTYNGSSVNLRPYFDGSLVSSTYGTGNRTIPVATNWFDAGGIEYIKNYALSDPTRPVTTNQQRLLNHLYSYFGGLLACSYYGTSPQFPAYDGDSSMYNAHKYMNLGPNELGYFIEQLGLAAQSFSVPDSAITEAASLILQSTFGQRCAQPGLPYSLPNATRQLQTICTNVQCPLAANASCGLYANISAPATATRSAVPSATTSSVAGGRLTVHRMSLGGLMVAIMGAVLLL